MSRGDARSASVKLAHRILGVQRVAAARVGVNMSKSIRRKTDIDIPGESIKNLVLNCEIKTDSSTETRT
jgi:hypothetical protein